MASTFTIKLIYDKAYKGYVAEVLNLPGCMSQGKTKREAVSNVKKAIKAFLKVRAEEEKKEVGEVRNVRVSLPKVFAAA
ncbi:MAG: type II toxin-antitoxin system HicB family antitoxin [Patescibacteria group bacterium]